MTLGFTPSFCITSRYAISAAFHPFALTSCQHNLKARGGGAPYEFRWVDSLLTHNVAKPLLSYPLEQ